MCWLWLLCIVERRRRRSNQPASQPTNVKWNDNKLNLIWRGKKYIFIVCCVLCVCIHEFPRSETTHSEWQPANVDDKRVNLNVIQAADEDEVPISSSLSKLRRKNIHIWVSKMTRNYEEWQPTVIQLNKWLRVWFYLCTKTRHLYIFQMVNGHLMYALQRTDI